MAKIVTHAFVLWDTDARLTAFRVGDQVPEWVENLVTNTGIWQELERVTTEEPTHDPENNLVTTPQIEGVEYSPDGAVEVPPSGLRITAVAEEGYILTEDSKTEWTFPYQEPAPPEPDPETDAQLFSPAEHNVADVNSYLDNATEEETQRVVEEERAGKNRSSIVNSYPSDDDLLS